MLNRASKTEIDFCSGPFLKKIIFYTLPIILTGLLQLLFNAADLMVVGQFRGNNAVSAVGATGSLINLIVCLFIGLSAGAGVCVAQAIGARDRERTGRIVHTAIPVAIFGGVVLTVVGIALSPTLLKWMDTPENVIAMSSVYMRIYFVGIVPIMVYNFGAAILRSAGDTKSPLLYLTIAGVINVILNLFFVVVCGMSADGVAWATTISQTVSCVLVLRKLMTREDGCRLEWKKLKIYKAVLIKIIRIGLPAGIQSALFSISNVLIQSTVNSFGEVVLSGNSAAANLEGFVYVSMNSFMQTAMTFVGQNVGAGKYQNVKKITGICVICVTVLGAALGGLLFLSAPMLLPLYLKEGGEAIMYGIVRLQYICLLYFLCGIMEILVGALRGMGASVVPMIVSIIGACGLRVGWIYTVFRAMPTLECLYISYPVSWVITISVLLICFFVVWKKQMKRQTLAING